MAFCRSSSCSRLLKQLLQLQLWQNSPLAKQSQYNFRHWDFVQLQGFRGRELSSKDVPLMWWALGGGGASGGSRWSGPAETLAVVGAVEAAEVAAAMGTKPPEGPSKFPVWNTTRDVPVEGDGCVLC